MEARRKALQKLRIDYDLSQDDVAKRLGVSRQYYCHVENGNRQGPPELWKKIQELFHLSDGDAWRLMHGTEEREQTAD